jgi:hypothetical protein
LQCSAVAMKILDLFKPFGHIMRFDVVGGLCG